ncbi:hypothetical protein RNI52_28020 [Labrys neptuniae]|nr:hypothetical protein [Labrys neptuniae]
MSATHPSSGLRRHTKSDMAARKTLQEGHGSMALHVPSAMPPHPVGQREVRQSPPYGYYFIAYPDTVSRLNIAKIQIKYFHKDLILNFSWFSTAT